MGMGQWKPGWKTRGPGTTTGFTGQLGFEESKGINRLTLFGMTAKRRKFLIHYEN